MVVTNGQGWGQHQVTFTRFGCFEDKRSTARAVMVAQPFSMDRIKRRPCLLEGHSSSPRSV